MIDRRSFIAAASMLPSLGTGATAQSPPRVARLGVLMDLAATDPAGITRVAALLDGLAALGWKAGSTLDLRIRWGTDTREQRRRDAQALLDGGVDVIVTSATPPTREVQQLTTTVPVVFTTIIDPVGGGFVESLARPGGNLTGFTNLEPSISGKWVQILLEVDPGLQEILTVMEPQLRASQLQAEAIADTARAAGKVVTTVDLLDDTALQAAFARAGTRRGGAVLTSSPAATGRRHAIIGAAQTNRVPAIYPGRHHVIDGALLSYGPDLAEPFRRAAGYVDRILRGEPPARLPVQLPTKLDMVLNARTARALGLSFPDALVARADDVIE